MNSNTDSNIQQRAWIATRKGLFELHRNSGAWTLEQAGFLGDPVSMALCDRRDGTLYAALNLGHFGVKLHRREPGAASWTEIAVPAYPPQPEQAADDVPWKLTMIWSLAAGGADEPGLLWAGTLPGGLFRSRDRGDTWELVRSLWEVPQRKQWFGGGYDVPGIHSICVDPCDSRRLAVAISCGGVWSTQNSGASWSLAAKGMRADYMPPDRSEEEEVQDPHRVVQCAANPDVLWCQHHNGMWRSADGGRLWQRIGEAGTDDTSGRSRRSGTSGTSGAPVSDFGFAVAAHPQDAHTAWFVPARADQQRIPVDAALAVTRTRDGGQSYETLRTGLPQEHCYDLIYRHGLAVDDDGRTLLMGSTTGGLWLSENGGDAWQTLSNNLPPVYAVGFF